MDLLLARINLRAKFEISISADSEDTKWDQKRYKLGGLVILGVISRLLDIGL